MGGPRRLAAAVVVALAVGGASACGGGEPAAEQKPVAQLDVADLAGSVDRPAPTTTTTSTTTSTTTTTTTAPVTTTTTTLPAGPSRAGLVAGFEDLCATHLAGLGERELAVEADVLLFLEDHAEATRNLAIAASVLAVTQEDRAAVDEVLQRLADIADGYAHLVELVRSGSDEAQNPTLDLIRAHQDALAGLFARLGVRGCAF